MLNLCQLVVVVCKEELYQVYETVFLYIDPVHCSMTLCCL